VKIGFVLGYTYCGNDPRPSNRWFSDHYGRLRSKQGGSGNFHPEYNTSRTSEEEEEEGKEGDLDDAEEDIVRKLSIADEYWWCIAFDDKLSIADE
jgi:hypothetical protein